MSPPTVADVFLNAPTRPDPEFVPLSTFMVHIWRMNGLKSEDALDQNRERERFVYWFYDTFHQTRAPYRLPAPPNTLQWLNRPALDVSSAFKASTSTFAAPKYYLTRYMLHVWKQVRQDLDVRQADGFLHFLTWFALECIPSRNLPPLLLPNDLLPALNEPVKPPLPLTNAMRILGELRGVAGIREVHTAPDEHIAAISFELLPDLLQGGDPRLVPDVVSRFWSAKVTADPDALTAYEYFAAQGCCPGLLPAGPIKPEDYEAVRRWYSTQYLAMIPQSDPLSSTAPATSQVNPSRAGLDSPERSIFLYRDYQTISGLSRAGIVTEKALSGAGLKIIGLDFFFRRTRMLEEHTQNQAVRRLARSALHILSLNPEYIPECLMCHFSLVDKSSYIIGQFYWELSDTATVHDCGLSLVNEIWVASEYLRDVYQKRTSVPIYVMGQAVEVSTSPSQFSRAAFDLPEDAYIFLFSFDAGSVVERKNPLAAVEAFRKAFPAHTENAILVLKTRNLDSAHTERDRNHWRRVAEIAATDRRIHLIDRTMTTAELAGLLSVCDSYVSLHRSEGFGYGPAEAMGMGKPVLTTGYSGVTDFCTSDTALLVDYKLQRVPRGAYPYMDDSREYYWAAPDIDHAALQMRRLYDHPQIGEQTGQSGRRFILENYSLEALRRRYLARLTELGWF